MKIAIIIWDLSISGGLQRQALELANYLVNVGNEVKIYAVYLNKKKCFPELLKTLELQSLYKDYSPRKNILDRFFYPLDILFSGRIVAKILELMDEDFDIINPHDYRTYRIGHEYKKIFGAPTVWMMNDLPWTVKKYKLFDGIGSFLKYFIFIIRGGPLAQLLDGKYISNMDKIVVLDYRNKKLLYNNLKLNSEVIRSGLDITKFHVREDKCLQKNGEIKILSAGIFYPHRRFEDLIFAISRLINEGYNIKLIHIGSDEYDPYYAKKIYNLVSRLRLSEDIDFLGRVSEKELIKNYSNSDIFVFPNYPQTWGLAIFEAMACGTPAIVSTGCGASEVLTDGENALLVPPNNSRDIAEKVKMLINDEELWTKLSQNGRTFVEGNIRWDLYGRSMEKLFRDLKARKGGHI